MATKRHEAKVKKFRWEGEVPSGLGSASILINWTWEMGKYKPFYNGCGIGPGTKTIGPAKQCLVAFLTHERNRRIAMLQEQLEALQNFDPAKIEFK